MLNQILNFQGAKSLNKVEQKSIQGGDDPLKRCTPEACAAEYNENAYETLPASSFKCVNGECQFV